VAPIQIDITFSISSRVSAAATRLTSPMGLMPLQAARAIFFLLMITLFIIRGSDVFILLSLN
jgi:hypothetical protein